MANNNTYKGITVKFGADTTGLGKALKDIDTQAKSINGDLKEIDKGLKFDSKNVELTSQKFQKLSEGIQVTQKRLEMLRSAQASAQADIANGVDGAEARYKDLQREIARTETTLSNFKKQVKEAGDAIKKDLSDSIEKLAGQVKTAAVTVGALVTALGGIAITSAKTADDINTLSKVTGISTEELQKFSYASSLIDVDVSTLQSSLQRLVRNMQGAKDGTGDAAEAFGDLGVNIKTGSDELRNNLDVFYEVIDALGKVENETQRDAYAMQIFGRQAQDLNPLIKAGAQALKDYGDQAENMGLVFDQQTLDNLNELNDKLDISKQQLKGASMIIGGELLNSFDSLFGGADRLLKLVQEAKEDGTLAEIADAAASAVEGFVSVVSSAVKFIYEYRFAILAGVEALIAYKAAMSISNIVSALTRTIKYFTAATEAAAAAQNGMNAAAAVNPYAVIAAAATLAITGIADFVAAQYEANAAFGEFFDKVEKELEQNNEAVKSYDQLKGKIDQNREARQKATSDIEGEYHGYEKLVERLYELSEVESKSQGQKAEMAEIVSKLESGVDGLSIAFNKETAELRTQRDEIEKSIEKSKELALAKAALANQESIAQDLTSAQLDRNKLELELESISKAKQDKIKEIAQKYGLEEKKSVHEFISEIDKAWQEQYSSGNEIAFDNKALKKELRELEVQESAITVRFNDASDKVKELQGDLDSITELTSNYSDTLADTAGTIDTVCGAAGDTSEALEEVSDAFEDAKSAASSYKSELASLISELGKVNSGTKYSTAQMLDLIEKYPELAGSIKQTSEGYELEAESIRKLIEEKARLMLTEAEEAERLAKQDYDDVAYKYNYERSRTAMYGLSDEQLFPELKKQFDEADKQWRNAKGRAEEYRQICADIFSGKYFDGVSSTVSGAAQSSAADYWKQSAEQEITQVEHLYKMGEISAEEYYRRLEEINKRYYENRAEYLTDYQKLEETVYSGLKKQQEEELSNTKTLLDRINAVRDARRQLEGAENKQVNVFSAAAGFHAEQDTAAIDKAAAALQSKQLELASLLSQKFGFDIKTPNLQGYDLSSLLPDLSGMRLPSAGSSKQQNVNVEYHAGNIYISGNADSGTVEQIRTLMNSEARKFFDEYLSDYIDRADRDRQTGGQ